MHAVRKNNMNNCGMRNLISFMEECPDAKKPKISLSLSDEKKYAVAFVTISI